MPEGFEGHPFGLHTLQEQMVGGVQSALGGAFAVTRLMQSLLFGITATDAATFVAAPLVLALVATAACFLPARRAGRTDPARVLREE